MTAAVLTPTGDIIHEGADVLGMQDRHYCPPHGPLALMEALLGERSLTLGGSVGTVLRAGQESETLVFAGSQRHRLLLPSELEQRADASGHSSCCDLRVYHSHRCGDHGQEPSKRRPGTSQVAPPLQGKGGQFCPRRPQPLSWQERKASWPLPKPPAARGMTIHAPPLTPHLG